MSNYTSQAYTRTRQISLPVAWDLELALLGCLVVALGIFEVQSERLGAEGSPVNGDVTLERCVRENKVRSRQRCDRDARRSTHLFTLDEGHVFAVALDGELHVIQ